MNTVGLIVLDGHDGSGKSTLAGWLREHHAASVYHCGYRFHDRMFAYHAAVLRRAVTESDHRLVVIERLWMSEVAYADVFRGGTRWPHEGRLMDRVLMRTGAVNVVCATSPEAARLATVGRPGLYHDARQERVARHFLGLVDGVVTAQGTYLGDLQQVVRHTPRADIVHYDYRRDGQRGLGSFAASLVDLVQRRRAARPAVCAGAGFNLAGNPVEAKVAMVGDVANPKNPKVAWPFFEYGNCSLYLAEACQLAGLPEHLLVWFNARGDKAEVLARHLAGAGVRMVALGREASLALEAWQVRHVMVRHPQAARRFTYHGKAGYAAELARAVALPCCA